MNNATTTAESVCGKCDGRGTLTFHMNVDNGKCFACMGSGRVRVQPVSVRNMARFNAAVAVDSLIESGDDVIESNPKYAQAMIRRTAENMLVVADTAWARRTLDTLPPRLRAAIIELGREIKTR